ncbi:hypothetical protein [Humibacter albus]|jgi:hypothetical protein|uniref:hypothetical protein n=1 Tax=Humibacter albus TaxID=427754 RepID=UPI0003B45F1C|nr:hypothetical protein [Humibacter albus]
MKRINVAGTSLVTGSALADAVLELWLRLARLRRYELAEIPFVDEDGTRQRARLVLCPSCPLWTSTFDSDAPELVDPVTLADIRQRAAELEADWHAPAFEE